MINHVVLFKLKPFAAEEKQTILDEVKALLENLQGKIEELKFIEVGINYELEGKSFDLALISHFNSIEELDKYRVHPEHVKVTQRMAEVVESRAAVDYIF
ncbi:protein containing stress responsive A/B barrel domain [Bacteroidales bacterium 6E]|nr:protein containing stress responsive A/B barrel domain [Bacteroidales bacterium 6E]